MPLRINNSPADWLRKAGSRFCSVWKTEHMFGIDGHQRIEPGQGVVFTRDLEGIGGEKTQFRVTYKHHNGGTVWGDDIVTSTDRFTAIDNGAKTVTLNS